jgi:hypothetical protein
MDIDKIQQFIGAVDRRDGRSRADQGGDETGMKRNATRQTVDSHTEGAMINISAWGKTRARGRRYGP